jgi:NDP-sugar pyrophosphorylase family protein
MPSALLLTAGLGTRLHPLTLVRAKPAVPIGGEPLVRRIIRGLVGQGVSDLVLNLHHLPETIAAAVGDGSDLAARVRYSWEQPAVLGSAGGPRQALPILGTDQFLIVNGDTLTDVDVAALMAAHTDSGALVTLALVPNREPFKYGGVLLGEAGHVTGFVKRGPAAEGSFHFVGVQAAQRRVFEALAPGEVVNSVGGLYDRLIARQPGAIRGLVTDAAFFDVGTVRDYWETSTRLGGNAQLQGARVRVDPTAQLDGAILWDDVEVGAGARLEECIVTDGAVIPAGAHYRRATIVGAGSALTVTPFD